MPDRIYLDHAATSPLRPEARAAMAEGFGLWANPSSPHAEGRKARAALEDARDRIRRSLGWDGELIFTSGASEALWIALNRCKMGKRLRTTIEHDAVIRAAPDAVVVVDLIDEEAMRGGIIAAQHVNSETGLIVPEIELLTDKAREWGGMVVCDCAQSAGKLALPDTDMIVVSAHKFGGPIGIGALLVRDFNLLEPVGGHERGYRQGTENLPGALGMAAALEAGEWGTTPTQRAAFAELVSAQRLTIGDHADYIFALAHPAMSAQALLIRLDAMGFAVSAGSACSSGTLKKSRVLDAFGVPDDVAARTIRVSLGWNTTPEELERFSATWASLA